MKIDLTQVFYNAQDTVIKTSETDPSPFTLKSALIQALLTDLPGDDGRPIPNAKKVRKYDLFRTIKKAEGEIDLPAEDVVLLKESASGFGTLLYGQVASMLEGKH